MAILNIHTGSWGTPDLGITEWIGDKFGVIRDPNTGGSSLNDRVGNTYSNSFNNGPGQIQQIPRQTETTNNVLGSQNTRTYQPSNQPSGAVNVPQPTIAAPNQGIDGGPSEFDIINNEYGQFVSSLDAAANRSRQNFSDFETGATRERDRGLSTVASERELREQELGQRAEAGRADERLNLQRVRQMLQDLEQKNAARISITGGGSTADALADRFARTAQQNVGGVLREGQEFQGSIRLEGAKANAFYDQKKREIEDKFANDISSARGQLQQTLDAIESEKGAAAGAKARARLDAWKSYLGQVNNARLQAASFNAQYDMWKRQVDAQIAASQGYSIGELDTPDYNQFYGNMQVPAIGATNNTGGIASLPGIQISGLRRGDEEEKLNQLNQPLGFTA